ATTASPRPGSAWPGDEPFDSEGAGTLRTRESSGDGGEGDTGASGPPASMVAHAGSNALTGISGATPMVNTERAPPATRPRSPEDASLGPARKRIRPSRSTS